MKNHVRDTTQGGFVRLLLTMAIPLMLGSMCQNLYVIADTAIVGRFVGVNALAAVGNTGWFTWPVVCIPYGLTQAGAILGAQRFGQRDLPGLRQTVYNTLLVTVLCSLVLTLVLQLAAPGLLQMVHTSELIYADSLIYLRINYAGILVVGLYNAFNAILRCLGNTRTPFIAMIVASLVNIVLDLVFVCIFHWGVAGAAIATVIGQAVSALFCGIALLRITLLRPDPGERWHSWKLCGRLCQMGLPLSAADLIVGIGGVVVQNQVNGYSVSFVAGYSATNRLYGLLETSGIALGSAFSTFIGQNFGANKFGRIHTCTRRALVMAVCMALVILCIVTFCREPILSLFVDSGTADGTEVMRYGTEYLLIMCAFLPVLYLLHIFRAGINALGNTTIPLLSGIVEFLMRVGVVLIFPSLLGYHAIFYAEIIAWCGAALLLCICYLMRLRKLPKQDA